MFEKLDPKYGAKVLLISAVVLLAIGLLITMRRGHSWHPVRDITEALIPAQPILPSKKETPPTKPSTPTIQTAPPPGPANQPVAQPPRTPPVVVPRVPWAEFSSEARRAIANDLLGQDESVFGRRFLVQCTSASQSRKRVKAYGATSDIVVVNARFRVSANDATESNWLKTYEVSESIFTDQFQGLEAADTVRQVIDSLKEQIQQDTESMSNLRKAFNP